MFSFFRSSAAATLANCENHLADNAENDEKDDEEDDEDDKEEEEDEEADEDHPDSATSLQRKMADQNSGHPSWINDLRNIMKLWEQQMDGMEEKIAKILAETTRKITKLNHGKENQMVSG